METARWPWLLLAVILFLIWRRGAGFAGGNMTVQELKAVLDQSTGEGTTLLIDVRESEEFAAGHVPGARHIPLNRVGRQTGDLAGFSTILVICQGGGRSAVACQILSGLLPKARVVNVRGGTSAWHAAGFPLER